MRKCVVLVLCILAYASSVSCFVDSVLEGSGIGAVMVLKKLLQ